MYQNPDELDRSQLACVTTYAQYFDQLERVVRYLDQWVDRWFMTDIPNTANVRRYIALLRQSFRALRAKKLLGHNECTLQLDISDSGFPNSGEISNLKTDFIARDELRDRFPGREQLLQLVLDHMLDKGTEPAELLEALANVHYLDSLEVPLMFPFTMLNEDNLVKLNEIDTGDEVLHRYLVSWSSYDYRTNRPYIYSMVFDVDIEEAPPHEQLMQELFRILQTRASQAIKLGDIALLIDGDIKWVRPKRLVRVCLGPLYSPIFHADTGFESLSEREVVYTALLNKYGDQMEDFMFFITVEEVVSGREVIENSLFKIGVTKQIFTIPDILTDAVAHERGATSVGRYVIMPHAVMQHIVAHTDALTDAYNLDGCVQLTYDNRGVLHGP